MCNKTYSYKRVMNTEWAPHVGQIYRPTQTSPWFRTINGIHKKAGHPFWARKNMFAFDMRFCVFYRLAIVP